MHSSVAQLSHEVRLPQGRQLASMTLTGSPAWNLSDPAESLHREIGDIRPQCVNVPVSFDQNLDVEFHQPFEAHEPLAAV